MDKRKVHLKNHPVMEDSDLNLLRSFLEKNELPHDDIQLKGNRFFLYREGNTLVGCGGIELYGESCLLRSVAVAKEFRDCGFGKHMVADLMSRATEHQIWRVWLLTETAEAFFNKLGFSKHSRSDAPDEIKKSSEFSSVCPVSAVLMSCTITKSYMFRREGVKF